ncbi:hypothetical protein JTB14_006656 [Gonioctena quinquepunctata]|nr:hypothetical protein JTB14_006656 [Gonioctena quinquepunctata]
MRACREFDWAEPGENSRICTQGNEIRQPNVRQDPFPIENENNDEIDVDKDEGNGENIRNVPVKLPTNQRVLRVWCYYSAAYFKRSRPIVMDSKPDILQLGESIMPRTF